MSSPLRPRANFFRERKGHSSDTERVQTRCAAPLHWCAPPNCSRAAFSSFSGLAQPVSIEHRQICARDEKLGQDALDHDGSQSRYRPAQRALTKVDAMDGARDRDTSLMVQHHMDAP